MIKPTSKSFKKKIIFNMSILNFVLNSVGHEIIITLGWDVEMLDNKLDHTYGPNPCMIIKQNKSYKLYI